MEVTKFRSQLFIALEQMTALFRQKTLTAVGRTVANGRRLGEKLRASTSAIGRLVAISRDAMVATNAKITRQAFVWFGQIAIHLDQAQDTLVKLGRSVAGQPRQLQDTLRARENDLRELLVSSPDAIVVTDVSHRFVEANRRALDLFGVSDANMLKFTVDIFLSRGQIPESDGNGPRFRRRNAKNGRCEIRRLDGSLRVAECRFIANFVPCRHLYKFRNVVAINQYQPFSLRTLGSRPARPYKSDLTSLNGATRR